MPWSNQDGGNGSGNQPPNRGPWGGGPSGGGVRPPDFEEVLRRARENIKHYLPGGGLGRGGMAVAALAVVALWLLSGFYIVNPYEQGVVLRFGRFVEHTGSGMHYHLPWPIKSVYTPNVKSPKQINIGYKPSTESGSQSQDDDVPDESLMLTGDENIVDMHFTVLWVIKDANAYLFNVDHADEAVKAVAESAMREVVGQERMDMIPTSGREHIQVAVQNLMQRTLDRYNAGVQIIEVRMLKADPPLDVRDAYLDVQRALADQDGKRNEAEAYANKIIPQARGEAAQIVQDAEAYHQQAIAEASGKSKRFLSVYQEYKKAPEVTRRRIYLETMSQVLAPMNKVIVDDAAKGVVPYFQLPALQKTLPSSRSQGNETVVATPNTQGSGQ